MHDHSTEYERVWERLLIIADLEARARDAFDEPRPLADFTHNHDDARFRSCYIDAFGCSIDRQINIELSHHDGQTSGNRGWRKP